MKPSKKTQKSKITKVKKPKSFEQKPIPADKETTVREIPRIRSIKPEFFIHEGLFDAEIDYGLPLRIAFMGLIVCSDRMGRFRWQPRRLKLHTVPYDAVDMNQVLDALIERGFIQKYEHQGNWYGVIPSFLRHQKIGSSEADSILPTPPESIFFATKIASLSTQNCNHETHFDPPCSNLSDEKLDRNGENQNEKGENFSSKNDALEMNLQKTVFETSFCEPSESRLDESSIEPIPEKPNKNKDLNVDLEFSKNENQPCDFNEKNFLFEHAQGKEGKGKELKGMERKGKGEKGNEGKGSEIEKKNNFVELKIRPRVLDPIQMIFEHWKTVMKHPNAKLDSKRRRLISKALKSGYEVEQLCQAIRGCSLTPHNIGDNDRGQRFDGLHVILRDADQIDRFIRNYQSPPHRLTETDRRTAANVQALQEWMKDELQEDKIYAAS